MPKTIEHIHWPDAPDLWMPYAPAIKVRGGTTVYLAGVTAAPVYHHHPHRPEEFDAMPRDMEGQARAALENSSAGSRLSARISVTLSRRIASSPISPIRMRSTGFGLSIFATPSPQRRPCKWFGSRPTAASLRSTRLRWSTEPDVEAHKAGVTPP